ncbi:hypothetical protein CARUB_v10010431mg [Capsella rubella]|uniref:Uncharacterized protein n=1 Tax=Capsella rubella TaxID=81985 RepID=R0IHD3_9BRAS|nr:uncharacterized protein LOC17897747 [Capsella rubella]EOA36258.1 hypothetical protein CARUB_v10010431mg [Capsella rubella]
MQLSRVFFRSSLSLFFNLARVVLLIFSMDYKSPTKAEAAPAVVKAAMPLQKNVNEEPIDDLGNHKKDKTEKNISDQMEILEGYGARLNRIEENMDLLISLIRSNHGVKTTFWKAYEAESMPMDESSDEEPSPFSRTFGGFGRGRGPLIGGGGGPHNLFVGGRFAGGRCGGHGFCGSC